MAGVRSDGEGGEAVKRAWLRPARVVLWGAVAVWIAIVGITVIARLSTPTPQVVPVQSGTNDLGTSVSIVPFNTLPGMPLRGVPAPPLSLQRSAGSTVVTVKTFRGQVLVLAFVNPVSTSALAQADREVLAQLQAKARSRVQVAVVDANPYVEWASWPPASGIYLSGSHTALVRVWKAYHVNVLTEGATVVHTPALYLIGPRGHEQRLFMLTGSSSKRVNQEVSAIWTDILAIEKHG